MEPVDVEELIKSDAVEDESFESDLMNLPPSPTTYVPIDREKSSHVEDSGSES